VHRVRVSVGQSVIRVCNKETHFIGDVPGSDSVAGFGRADGVSMLVALPALFRFLASSFKIPPVPFVHIMIRSCV